MWSLLLLFLVDGVVFSLAIFFSAFVVRFRVVESLSIASEVKENLIVYDVTNETKRPETNSEPE